MKKEAETMQRKRKIGDLEVGLYETVISLTTIVQIPKYFFCLLFWPVTRIRDILILAYPYLWLTDSDPTPDPDPDPGIFVSDLQDDNQEIFFF